MKRIFSIAPLIVLAVTVDAASAQDAVGGSPSQCTTGQVSVVNYGGYETNKHWPWISATINGTSIYIGLSDGDSAKARSTLSDMHSVLMSAMMSGMSVSVSSTTGTCANPTEKEVLLSVSAPTPS